MFENHSWSEIKTNAYAPYLNNTLVPRASHCEQYNNVPGMHPSLPNYIWLEAGTNFGVYDDYPPATNHQNTPNHLVTLLNNAGVSWRAYQTSLDGTTLPLDGTCNCQPHHNPFVYFDDVTGTNNPYYPYGVAHIRPYGELAGDLTSNTVARYNFIIPDNCYNMHSACPTNAVLQGDNWLSQEVPKILNSRAYQDGGALFIVFDETDSADTTIPIIVLSPFARGGGYASTNYYTHSSMLRTLQEIFNVTPLLGDAANASNLSDLFLWPAKFQITSIAGVGPSSFQLTVTGLATNAPLILNASSDLANWIPVWTNPSPAAAESTVVSNGQGSAAGPRFYRFTQAFP